MAKQTGKYSRAQKEDEQIEAAFRNISGSKSASNKSKKTHRTGAVIAICAALIAITVCVVAGCLYFSHAWLAGVILENVSVAGVDVGGMTQAQAINAVSAATEKTFFQTPMVVTVFDSTAEIPASCVKSLDIKGAVKAAYKFGNSGSQSKRQEQQKIAMESGYVVDLTPYLELDTDAVKQILAQLGSNYSSTLSQSSYEVTGNAPEQVLVVHLGMPEYGLDLNALYEQVLDAYSRNIFSVEGECGMIEPDPIDLEAILERYYVAPINASFDTTTYEIIEGTAGYGFDVDSARTLLAQSAYGSTVEIPFTDIAPEVTGKDLTTVLYRDTLATYTAEADSETGRDTNLRLACEAINGLVLYPGEFFSYNNTLGERTEAKGYKLGPSFSGNNTVYTIGGGICQVSSALYYCAMVADLEILMRESHGLAPSYMPVGTDATVSWGSIDFRFRNTSNYPIRIEATAQGGTVTVTLVGTDDKDYYVTIEQDILGTYEYTVSYQTMAANNAEGYKNGDYITEPYTGYDVRTYRCKYSKETDELLSREFEAESNYRTRNGVICQISSSSGIGNGSVTDEDGALPD